MWADRKKFAVKRQSIILTRENSRIFFDTSFKWWYELFCSNLIFSMKKMLNVKKSDNGNFLESFLLKVNSI